MSIRSHCADSLRRALGATAVAVAVAIAIAPLAAQTPPRPAATGARVPLYTDLGTHRWPVTTRHPDAQRYFDQGLRLAWAFNHAEAIRAFEEGERLDPTCAMCAWGVAWALGPHINAGMDSAAGVRARAAVRRAQERAARVSPRERALIGALAARYSDDPTAERAPLDSAWARALAPLAERHPADQEIQVLHADALMNLSPWNYWNADGTPRPGTAMLLRRLEGVMAANPRHPGACHLFIHAVEAHEPARALPCAERLAALMPGAGHLVHMPGHIYIRVGRYEDAIRANEHAVHADESYIRDQRPGAGVYTVGYYPHNYDFLAFAASMMGRRAQATAAAERLVSIASDDMLRAPGMGFLQTHVTRHLQMKVRFGQWQAILDAPTPSMDLPHARAMWHYARGRALAAQGNVAGARAEWTRLVAGVEQAERTPLRLEFNSSAAVLAVAREVLAGHIAARTGDTASAVGHLREAARLEDALVYGEPPEWSVPVRQELGIVLLDAGRPGDAERVFREDLKRFPENGWSLQGLARSLEAQGRRDEAARVRAALARAWKGADLPIDSASAAPAQAASAVAGGTPTASTSLVDAPDRYFTREGVTIRYREIGAGEPVLLLHGYTDRVEMWKALADSLAGDYRVVVPDIRGFGKSSKSGDPAFYGRAMVEDLSELLEHLAIPHAHVVGYSMGAVLAANLALDHPTRVQSVAFVAGPFWPDSASLARTMRPYVDSLERGQGLAPFFRWILPTWPDSIVTPVAKELYVGNDSASLVASVESLPGLMVDSTRAARGRAPALAIVGIDDREMLRGSEDIARWWPNTTHVVLPRGDHADIYELPEAIRAIRRHLTGMRQ